MIAVSQSLVLNSAFAKVVSDDVDYVKKVNIPIFIQLSISKEITILVLQSSL